MSGLTTPAVQVGLSGTATQNFTLTTGADGTATLARGNVGATTQDVLTIDAAGNIAFPQGFTGMERPFVSAEQTITAAGALTIAHGLGASPSLIQGRYICKTAEHNYSIGDELIVSLTPIESSLSYGMAAIPDATNISIRFGSHTNNAIILDKTTGALANMTNANWKLVVRAWK